MNSIAGWPPGYEYTDERNHGWRRGDRSSHGFTSPNSARLGAWFDWQRQQGCTDRRKDVEA